MSVKVYARAPTAPEPMMAAAGESDSSGNAASYQQRSELLSYDGLNRLSGSAMTVGTGATATSDSRWSERNIRYDLDGNILHLERYQEAASVPQATLDFSYDGPKRNGYSYDSNGNITCDPLRCTVEITVLRAQPQLSAMRVLLIPRLCSRRISL